ncbi:MAG: creatininase family protein [Pseudomonadota bacterium]
MTGRPRPALRWREMPARAFQETADWIAVLPLAAIEQHGPHLPLGVDAMIAEAMVAAVLERLEVEGAAAPPASFLPVMEICKSDEHLAYRGTLTLGWETAIRAWLEIGASVARAGVRKLIIVTAHGGNVAPMGVVARELRIRHGLLVVTCSWGTGTDVSDLLPAAEADYGIHGGAAETAMMLAIAPGLVSMPLADDFRTRELENKARFARLRAHGAVATGWMAQDLNIQGAAGDARAGSAEIGREIIARQADGFMALLREVDAVDPQAQLTLAAPGSLPLGEAP